MKVLNFGSLNVDYVYQVDHMVQGGETLSSGEMNVFLGGKGFNQSAALAKAGVPVYHAGMIGEDGKAFLDVCKEYGIQTDFIKVISGKSGHTIIQVDKNAQNCILLYGGANRAITKDYVDEVLGHFEKGDFLLLQNEISELDYIIDKAFEIGMTIVLNPSPFDAYLDACDMTKVSYFLLNEIEGEQISGEKDPEKIILKMQEIYPNSKIMLTLGKNGSVYAENEMRIWQKIIHVPAVDTTAAGDTFTGYFIAGLIAGYPMKENLEICANASAIAVSRNGASLSIPYKKEVEEKMKGLSHA